MLGGISTPIPSSLGRLTGANTSVPSLAAGLPCLFSPGNSNWGVLGLGFITSDSSSTVRTAGRKVIWETPFPSAE